jgi:diaminopimelate epimerase
MGLRFFKFHGFGNDYLVLRARDTADRGDPGALAKRICDRHYGAGADGIAVVSKSQTSDADFNVRIFNPDGSEAGLSGNGTRCAAAYLYYTDEWRNEVLRLSTKTGIKHYFLREKLGHGKYLFESELGIPKFEPASIPMIMNNPSQSAVDYSLAVDEISLQVTALQMGNPNCCLFVNEFDDLDWRKIGRAIEVHPQFPERTNVVFIKIIDRNTIELRIWERGVGETSASGTCSCAGAVASMMKGLVDRTVRVITPGGEVQVQWRPDNEVVITGTAEVVYSADWLGKT